MHYKSRFRMSLVLLILVLLVLSCSTPLPTVISTSLPNHTQEVNSTPSIPFLTDPVEFTPAETPTVTAIPVPLLYAKVVSAGFMQTCAVTLSNGLKCWGNYVTNHPGDSSNNYHTYPEDIPGLENGVDDISSYGDFSCVLLTSGGVKCWGSNTYGSLGDDRASGDYSWDPVDVVGLSSGVNVITTGMYHVCALLQNGSVKCWGANAGGLLGNGTIDTYIIYRHSNQCRLPPKGLDKRLSSPKLLQGVSRFIGKFFKILCAEIGHVVLLPITP
jgi:hypothetical protein